MLFKASKTFVRRDSTYERIPSVLFGKDTFIVDNTKGVHSYTHTEVKRYLKCRCVCVFVSQIVNERNNNGDNDEDDNNNNKSKAICGWNFIV